VQRSESVKGTFMQDPRIGMVITLGCIWLGGCAARNADDIAVDDQPRADADRIEVREEYFPDGSVKLRTEGRLGSDGEFIAHGAHTLYWENGQKRYEEHYVQGMRHGPRSAWYESGQIRSQGQYINDREDGAWTEWYPSGRKMQELHFDHGSFHGTFIEWWPNGQMRRQLEWIKGKKQGTMTLWDEEGNVRSRVEYVDDVAQP